MAPAACLECSGNAVAPWCPRSLRDGATDYLGFALKLANPHALTAHRLATALARSGDHRIVDLCSERTYMVDELRAMTDPHPDYKWSIGLDVISAHAHVTRADTEDCREVLDDPGCWLNRDSAARANPGDDADDGHSSREATDKIVCPVWKRRET